MKKYLTMFPFSILFLSFFPVISLYSHNIEHLTLEKIILPIFLITTTSIGIFLLINGIIRDRRKTSVIVSFFLITFFSFGGVFDYLLKTFFLKRFQLTFLLTGLWVASLIWLVILIYRAKNNHNILYGFFNIFSVLLILLPSIQVVYFYSKNSRATQAVQAFRQNEIKEAKTDEKRDIYYIVFDRYAGEDTFKNDYNFDNSQFLETLESRGFYVARESFANYPKTAHSLASSLNSQYLGFMADQYGKEHQSWEPLYEMVNRDWISQYFRENGYKYVYFGSWWQATSQKDNADQNVNIRSMSEFNMRLYESTPAYYLTYFFTKFDDRGLQYRRIKYQFNELEKIPNTPEPTFVFAHFLVPHPPFVFDKDGEMIAEEVVLNSSEQENYLRQVEYVNKEVVRIASSLIERSEKKPIIIIQSDEGPYPKRYSQNLYGFDWTKATKEEQKQKMEILNALYLPEGGRSDVQPYPDITPVNTFRLIISKYFDDDVALLTDKSFVFKNHYNPYDFYEVTEVLKKID